VTKSNSNFNTSLNMLPTVLLIGGAGAQGQAVVKILSANGLFHSKVLTRNSQSPQATSLAELPNVTIMEGENDEPTLLLAMKDIDACFVNTNGFGIGEKNEIYWGIRMFELARRSGVKHFIYSSLDYLGPKTNYNPKFDCMHYLGKARVSEFMKSQPTTPMNWSILTTGPYMDALSDYTAPNLSPDDLHLHAPPRHRPHALNRPLRHRKIRPIPPLQPVKIPRSRLSSSNTTRKRPSTRRNLHTRNRQTGSLSRYLN